MIWLVSVSEVQDRLGIGDVPVAAPVLKSALVAAHLRIQTELDTKFERKSNVEAFFLDDVKHNGIVPEGFFRCRLKNGLLRDDVPAKVELFDTLDALRSGDPGEDVTDKCQLNKTRGWLYVPGTDRSYPSQYTSWPYPVQAGGPSTANVLHPSWFNGKFVKVSYDSGFVKGDDGAVADGENVPDELKEAILGYVPVVIDFSSVTNTSAKNVTHPYEAAGDHALAILTPLRRRLPLALEPIY